MLNNISRIFSYVFQPLIMPTLVFLVMMYYYPLVHLEEQYKYFVLLVSILFTFVFPALILLGMFKFGLIGTIDIDRRKERIVPYLITIFFYGIMTYVMISKEVHVSYVIAALSMITSILISWIITFFWKISAHLVAMGGLVGLMLRLVTNFYSPELVVWFIVALLLTGILMMSRVYLKAHTLAQVYLGFVLGGLISYLSTYLLF